MASAKNNNPEHGLTETLYHISPIDFGPLNVINDEALKNFRSGSYFVTTPKSEMIILYRLSGGNAKEDGEYWTTERREGNEGSRHDMGLEKLFGNTLTDENILLVPKGILLYEGTAGPQQQYLGGGWQVFIPKNIVKLLLALTQLASSGNWSDGQSKAIMQQIMEAQTEINNKYCNKYVKNHVKNLKMDFLKDGSLSHRLPSSVKTFLSQADSGYSNCNGIQPTGTYKIHEESISFPDGSRIKIGLSKTVELVSSSTRTYNAGKNTVVETTNRYKISEVWG